MDVDRLMQKIAELGIPMESVTQLKTARPANDEETMLLSETAFQRMSFLAKRFCKLDLELTVCRSGAGYYLGCNDDFEPVARDSVEYWKTPGEAEAALEDFAWTQRLDP
jgi:hypothetical protein